MNSGWAAWSWSGRSSGGAATGRGKARVLLALLVAAAIAPAQGPAAADGAPVALDIDVPVVNESFEGAFPGGSWSANDTNASSGFDYWAATTYRAASGNRSVWSAGNGSQLSLWDAGEVPPVNTSNITNVTVFFEDFEGGAFASTWGVSDEDATSGNDTWGVSTARAFAGLASVWSAQVGYNDELLDDNVNVSTYDNDQSSYVWRSVDLSNISNDSEVVLEYWYWLDSESCCDYLYPMYFSGGSWNYPTSDSGTSNGWTFASVPVSKSATAVGFFFYTDYSVIYEGAYLDNVTLVAAAPPKPPQPAGPFVEDFEPANATGNWSATDDDAYQGKDFWGISTARSYSGGASLWSAQVGQNSNWGAPNANVAAYDDGMYALAWRPIVNSNLSDFPSATFKFWYWLDSESGYDYFSAMVYNASAGWTALNSLDGNSGGWVSLSFTVPNDTERIGFLFTTDGSVIYEGVYVDDVEFFATRNDPNEGLRTYDTFMNTTLGRTVSVAPYALAYLEYSYWLETDSGNDTLEAMVLAGPVWTSLDRASGNSSGWRSLTFEIPTNSTRVAFRFVTDGSGRSEGAYLDDVRVWGVVFPVNCTAEVGSLTGLEGVTPFLYTLQAADGLPPYRYAWNFSDGSTSVAPSPSRTFADVGTYTATVNVTDALGQSCTAQAPSVVVTHDITAVSVDPVGGSLIEGRSVSVNASDVKGHAIDFNWALSVPECGVLSAALGPFVLFTASEEAGGLVCTVTASAGGAAASATFQVLHDSSVIRVAPPVLELIEGEALSISAVDAFGHELTFGWAASCGRVSPSAGTSTAFTADDLGGEVCGLRVTSPMAIVDASIPVLHDTRTLAVAPGLSTIVEGASQTFSVVDAYVHPADAEWTVSPTSCGAFSVTPASLTVFTASQEAGDSTCTVSAAAGAGVRSVEVRVRHHFGASTLSPLAATVAEAGLQAFSVLDTYGHPFDAAWDLSPSHCGALSTASGPGVTLTVGRAVGLLTCTVRATSAGVSLLAQVNVTHSAPASVEASANVTTVFEGGSVLLEASVLDGAGHKLSGLPVRWQATCGNLDSETGAGNTLFLSTDAGGTACNVTATHGAFSAALSISVRHAGPFTLAVTSAGAEGGPQTFTATVKDPHGHSIPEATVAWTATCGALSEGAGLTTTFTPPGDLGGSTCTVRATSAVGTETSQVARTLTTGMSAAVPLGVVLAIAGAVGALFLLRARRRKGGSP